MKLNPRNADMQFVLGQVLLQRGNYDGAVTHTANGTAVEARDSIRTPCPRRDAVGEGIARRGSCPIA